MKNSTASKKYAATSAKAIELVADIARLQEQRAELIARLAAEVRTIDTVLHLNTQALTRELAYGSSRPSGRIAEDVRNALEEHRVNVGELSSQLSKVMEASGFKAYPETYRPISTPWAITTR